jgi:hypothetical protein
MVVPNHFSCDAQQYWTPAVTHVTDENAKEVLVILNSQASEVSAVSEVTGS